MMKLHIPKRKPKPETLLQKLHSQTVKIETNKLYGKGRNPKAMPLKRFIDNEGSGFTTRINHNRGRVTVRTLRDGTKQVWGE